MTTFKQPLRIGIGFGERWYQYEFWFEIDIRQVSLVEYLDPCSIGGTLSDIQRNDGSRVPHTDSNGLWRTGGLDDMP
jgi:hypothetical protein